MFWDLEASKVPSFAVELRGFLETYLPRRLLVSGPLDSTLAGIERNGADLLLTTFTDRHPNKYKQYNLYNEVYRTGVTDI